ncbi:hypothetical protein MMAN_22290 [Mycobacterium mantenii]|uniref:Integrase catalytic domain-containing protein n=1 Tax=Mycobacterium mantenii TaxID=560555 RepID=A0ABN6A9D4_MYCNT|nr:hypothetical protein MMAN_22290 [Mycobacterium mantenii]
MVFDAIEHASWVGRQQGVLDFKDVVHHTTRSQHTSIRFPERLAEAGIQPLVGAAGGTYDNALAETINGLDKTEVSKPGKPWRPTEDVELATVRWFDLFNHRRLSGRVTSHRNSASRPYPGSNIDETEHGPARHRDYNCEPMSLLRGLTELHVGFTPAAANGHWVRRSPVCLEPSDRAGRDD